MNERTISSVKNLNMIIKSLMQKIAKSKRFKCLNAFACFPC